MNLLKMNEEEPDNVNDDDQQDGEEMSGWADSMLKILKSTKPKNKKDLILSRARKDYEVSKTQPQPQSKKFKKADDLEIARDPRSGDDSKVSNDEEKTKSEAEAKDKATASEDANIMSLKQQRKLELRQRKLERAWENLNRLTTEAPDRELEADLIKIATKGVVQLFNAVAQQQKSLKTKLRASSKSEFKKDKVFAQSKELFDKAMTKNKFTNDAKTEPEIKEEELSSDDERGNNSTGFGKRKRNSERNSSIETSEPKKPVWQALQDDFMLDAKLKDWDKDSDSD